MNEKELIKLFISSPKMFVPTETFYNLISFLNGLSALGDTDYVLTLSNFLVNEYNVSENMGLPQQIKFICQIELSKDQFTQEEEKLLVDFLFSRLREIANM